MVSSSAQALAVTEDDEPRVEPRQGGFTGTYRLLVRGKNINQNTLLATDYLNHFNEIIMLLEMVPSMPECYRDAVEWRPKSYAQHFRDSCFSDAELRSEEHTSELQSLMRTSYAVFCLKKKNKTTHIISPLHHSHQLSHIN